VVGVPAKQRRFPIILLLAGAILVGMIAMLIVGLVLRPADNGQHPAGPLREVIRVVQPLTP
jgi:Tfp pilus assembly protein PilN